MWLSLKDWAAAHDIDPRTVIKMIDAGIIGNDDYFHHGRVWRIRKDLTFHNKVVLKLKPCKNFLRELEAI